MKPSFRSKDFLLAHVDQTMRFYHPRCIDPAGGFFHFFRDDGRVYDAETRHLVSSARFVFNYAMAYRHFGRPEYLNAPTSMARLRYADLLRAATVDNDVKVVVIRGVGDNLGSGADDLIQAGYDPAAAATAATALSRYAAARGPMVRVAAGMLPDTSPMLSLDDGRL